MAGPAFNCPPDIVKTLNFGVNSVGNTYVKAANDTDVGAIASVRQSKTGTESWQMAVLIYNSADTTGTTGTDNVKLDIQGLTTSHNKNSSQMYTIYLLDNQHGNPYTTWKSQGKPVFPTRKQLQAMRSQQEPVRIKGPIELQASSMTLDLSLDKPGVLLLHICDKPTSSPGQVTGLRLYNVTSQDILVIWDDTKVGSRCLLTYQVEYSSTGKGGTYQRVNTQDIIFTTFVHSKDIKQDTKYSSAGESWYRVCAVDYWGNKGQYSNPVNVGHV